MESGLEESSLDARELESARMFLGSDLESPGHKNGAPTSFRNPLHLALAVSPLYLLIPAQLLKATVGRKNLLNVSRHSLRLK